MRIRIIKTDRVYRINYNTKNENMRVIVDLINIENQQNIIHVSLEKFQDNIEKGFYEIC